MTDSGYCMMLSGDECSRLMGLVVIETGCLAVRLFLVRDYCQEKTVEKCDSGFNEISSPFNRKNQV